MVTGRILIITLKTASPNHLILSVCPLFPVRDNTWKSGWRPQRPTEPLWGGERGVNVYSSNEKMKLLYVSYQAPFPGKLVTLNVARCVHWTVFWSVSISLSSGQLVRFWTVTGKRWRRHAWNSYDDAKLFSASVGTRQSR